MSVKELSADEISEIIRKLDGKAEYEENDINFRGFDNEELGYENLESYNNDRDRNYYNYLKELEEKLGGQIKLISSERTEGSGDFDGYEWIYELNGRYFQLIGYYHSYDGYDCDDWYDLEEVKPIEKTITVYEPI